MPKNPEQFDSQPEDDSPEINPEIPKEGINVPINDKEPLPDIVVPINETDSLPDINVPINEYKEEMKTTMVDLKAGLAI